MQDRILVTGAAGQLGLELTNTLIALYGPDHVIASDINERWQLLKMISAI